MITKIDIKNMRCFKDFTLDDIGQVNIIAGENNVGKTTLLEAIFFLFACYVPDLFWKMAGIRGVNIVPPTPALLWEHFFYKLTNEALQVSCVVDKKILSLSVHKDTQALFVKFPSKEQIIPSSIDGHPLQITIKNNEDKNTCYHFIQGDGYGSQWEKQPISQGKHVFYIGPRNHFHTQFVSELFSNVVLQGKKDELISNLRILDNSIEDITTIVLRGIPYVYANQNGTSLPITTKGDGINKLLFILCTMLSHQDGIFLIDEIENGFHYSFYPALWKTIERVARSTGGQVFATTHSYECIEGAATALKDSEIAASAMRYIRLDRNKGVITPHVLTNEILSYAIEKNMEIR